MIETKLPAAEEVNKLHFSHVFKLLFVGITINLFHIGVFAAQQQLNHRWLPCANGNV